MRYAMALVVIATSPPPFRSPPRTAWGDPDLQGFWPSVEQTGYASEITSHRMGVPGVQEVWLHPRNLLNQESSG